MGVMQFLLFWFLFKTDSIGETPMKFSSAYMTSVPRTDCETEDSLVIKRILLCP